ncbi:MAG TPA: hypothetical protein VHL58_17530 [Thermoanaerobaculia bacterium]|nr:hypothetical protein [Thermoanaerobaculia bacterium]
MNCPKCGSLQLETSSECASCGIIFSRYRASEGPSFAVTSPVDDPRTAVLPPNVPDDDSLIRVPQWTVIVGVSLLVILGIKWTSNHQAARTEPTAATLNNQLNEINQKGIAARRNVERLERAHRERTREQITMPGYLTTLPPDLTKENTERLINAAEAMTVSSSVKFPKQFSKHLYSWTLQEYPALFAAVHAGLVEFDPPLESIYTSGRAAAPNFAQASETINVNLTLRGRTMRVNEGESFYVAELGPRRVATLGSASSTPGHASVAFTWQFEDELGNVLKTDPGPGTGFASFLKDGSWRVESMTVR